MKRRTLEDAFKAGFLAGFDASGEGWNGEYPFSDKCLDPQDDKSFNLARDLAYTEFKSGE